MGGNLCCCGVSASGVQPIASRRADFDKPPRGYGAEVTHLLMLRSSLTFHGMLRDEVDAEIVLSHRGVEKQTP
jgi:hypothetical protein